AALDTVEGRREASEVLVDTLVDLHAVDLDAAGLTDFARPEGYLERQIDTFTRLAPLVTERDLPLIAELATWLRTHRPESQRTSLVHGDYRFGNIMFAPGAPARVQAVLDWEMATLGDPLADLGYLVAMYADEGATGNSVTDLSPATRQPGYFTSEQIVDRYAQRSG